MDARNAAGGNHSCSSQSKRNFHGNPSLGIVIVSDSKRMLRIRGDTQRNDLGPAAARQWPSYFTLRDAQERGLHSNRPPHANRHCWASHAKHNAHYYVRRSATDRRGHLGSGTHKRVVVSVARFDERVQRKLRDG